MLNAFKNRLDENGLDNWAGIVECLVDPPGPTVVEASDAPRSDP